MLKLIKYEFRKNITAILILLTLTVALEGYFLYGLHAMVNGGNEAHGIIAMAGLGICIYVAIIYVLVTGVTTYTKEMKDRSAYLIFMTPNSGLKIMGSKYLYTLTNMLLFTALYGGLAAVDAAVMFKVSDQSEEVLREFSDILLMYGVRLDQIALAVLVAAVYVVLSLLSFMAVVYLAVTLSHTLFRDKKWRGVVSLVFFVALNWLISKLGGLLPNAMDTLTIVEMPGTSAIAAEYGIQTATTLSGVMQAMLPQAGLSLGVILASLFGCAWMLDKKVSL